MSEDALIQFGLSKGNVLSKFDISNILNFDQKIQCLQQAYRYLSRRPHLEKELFLKLLNKGFQVNTINDAFVYLHEKGYLNDTDFIRLFIREQSTTNKSGPLLIKKKLLDKGAELTTIDKLLQSDYPIDRELDNARLHLQKKLTLLKGKTDKENVQKLVRYLQQKGFAWDTIRKVFSEHELINRG